MRTKKQVAFFCEMRFWLYFCWLQLQAISLLVCSEFCARNVLKGGFQLKNVDMKIK